MQIRQNGPLEKYIIMHSNVLCIVTYGMMEIYAVQIYATGT